MALKQQAKLSDTTTDGEDALITIRGFLNIVALIQRVESDAEKIALNCLLLLVITGFRSIEAFNLRQDALFKRQIDDPALCKRFQDKGLPDYFLGIRYVGVKGAGERTHWVEPLAVPLVESIFSTVKMLTAPIRSHLTYLRAKSFADYLPQASVKRCMSPYTSTGNLTAPVSRISDSLYSRSLAYGTPLLNGKQETAVPYPSARSRHTRI